MGKKVGAGNRLTVVLVDGRTSDAVVPIDSDRLLLPEGSVTVEAIERAARRVFDQRGGSSIAAISEATIDRRRELAGA